MEPQRDGCGNGDVFQRGGTHSRQVNIRRPPLWGSSGCESEKPLPVPPLGPPRGDPIFAKSRSLRVRFGLASGSLRVRFGFASGSLRVRFAVASRTHRFFAIFGTPIADSASWGSRMRARSKFSVQTSSVELDFEAKSSTSSRILSIDSPECERGARFRGKIVDVVEDCNPRFS